MINKLGDYKNFKKQTVRTIRGQEIEQVTDCHYSLSLRNSARTMSTSRSNAAVYAVLTSTPSLEDGEMLLLQSLSVTKLLAR